MAWKWSIILSLCVPLAWTLPQAGPSPPSSSVASAVPSPSATGQVVSLTSEERAELFDLHEQLVDIPSISMDEIECADFLYEYLSELGYHVEKVSLDSGRFNVFAYPQELKNQSVWPEVLITSHLDTVAPFIPFERREKNGTVFHYGRGTVDAKGPVAAMIVSAHSFLQSRSNSSDTPRLGMLFVVGEEIGGDGMKAFASYAKNVMFRAGIFGEPTEGKLASGHKGSHSVTLEVKGRPAHSAYPWLGISAIDWLIEGMAALNGLEPYLPSSELLGASTLNIGLVSGGVAPNIVPESANATASIRIATNSTQEIQTLIEESLTLIKKRAEGAGAEFNVTYSATPYAAVVLDTDVPGLEIAPVFYGTDIPSLPQVEKKYLYGTSTIEVAHTALEEISQLDLIKAAEAYGMILRHLFPEA